MRRRARRGQAMVEYALISATVVMAFAALSATNVLQPVAQQAQDPVKNDYVLVPDPSECAGQPFSACIKTLAKDARNINEQLRTR